MPEKTNLTVAKICHEFANYLSILNFIGEDIVNKKEVDKGALAKTIELLTHTMIFFRNVYSDNINYKSMVLALKQIFSLKNMIISCDDDIVFFNVSEKVKCVVYGLLYIVMKIAKPGDKINISRHEEDIVIALPPDKTLPSSISKAISEEQTEDNIFNIFASKIRENAVQTGYRIKTTNNEIVVWKK